MGFFAELVKALIAPITDVIIADQTNQANEDMMHEQMDYNKEMLADQREYDSPANQMKRNKEAGLNPVAQSMASGTLQNTSPSALPINPIPRVNPMANFASDISHLFGAKLAGSQAKTEDRLRELRAEQINRENQQTVAQTELLGLQAAEQKVVNQYCDARESLAIQGGKADIALKWSQFKDSLLTIKEHKFRIEKWLPEELKTLIQQQQINVLEMDRVIAVIANTNQDTAKKHQETLTEVENTANTKLEGRLEADKAVDDHNLAEQYIRYYSELVNEVKAKTGLTEQESYWFILTHLFGNSTTLKKVGKMFIGKLDSKLPQDDPIVTER